MGHFPGKAWHSACLPCTRIGSSLSGFFYACVLAASRAAPEGPVGRDRSNAGPWSGHLPPTSAVRRQRAAQEALLPAKEVPLCLSWRVERRGWRSAARADQEPMGKQPLSCSWGRESRVREFRVLWRSFLNVHVKLRGEIFCFPVSLSSSALASICRSGESRGKIRIGIYRSIGMGRRFTRSARKSIVLVRFFFHGLNIPSMHSFGAFVQFILDTHARLETFVSIHQDGGEMRKDIIASVIRLDESISFCITEPFDRANAHDFLLSRMAYGKNLVTCEMLSVKRMKAGAANDHRGKLARGHGMLRPSASGAACVRQREICHIHDKQGGVTCIWGACLS